VLVQVKAYGINPLDWKVYDGSLRRFLPASFPGTPGYDFAGEIQELGEGVVGFHVGSRVYARTDARLGNAAAERLVCGAAALAPMPSTVDFLEAAALPLAACAALQGFQELGGIRPGMSVLVFGASGGVGHLAVQIAKAKGAQVTAVCSRGNFEMVRKLGADALVDSHGFAWATPHDLVFDCIGKASGRQLLSSLKQGGTAISVGFSFGLLLASLSPRPFSKKRVKYLISRPDGGLLRQVTELVDSAQLRPVIEEVYPLERVAEALERSRAGHVKGKLVVRIAD
jgi:NADPH:quinone reductase-like Zn-dependent oxidoreductase